MSNISFDVAFKSATAVSACLELWKVFFDHIDEDPAIDLAVWEMNGSVKLSPMSTQQNEGANEAKSRRLANAKKSSLKKRTKK